ncbi:MAG: DUF3568 family protein [Phycisphaeraceae bacterium]
MQQFRRMTMVMFLVVAAAVSGGCLAAAAGAGVGAFHAVTNAEGTVEAGSDEVIAAARAVFAEMDITEIKLETDDGEISLLGRTIADKRVLVEVKPQAAGLSELEVRVGRIGNEATAERIYARIRKRLE